MFEKKKKNEEIPAEESKENAYPLSGIVDEIRNILSEEIENISRRAGMSSEELSAEDDRIRREEFETERAGYMRERQEFLATKLLNEKGLDSGFASMCAGASDEETLSNIESFSKLFGAALEQAISVRLKGRSPRVPEPETQNDPFLAGLSN